MAKESMSLISYLLLFVLIVGFFCLPNADAAENRISGFIAFSPIGRSYRYKHPIFLPDKEMALLGGGGAEQFTDKYMATFSVWLKVGGIRYYDVNNTLKGADDYEGLLYASYGRSLWGKGGMYAFAGLGMYGYEIASVLEDSGGMVVSDSLRESGIRLGILGGIRGGVNKRIGYEYKFCSSARVRHQVNLDLRLGRIPKENEKIFGDEVNLGYFRLGGGFDERKTYNLLLGFKWDLVWPD